MEGWDVRFLPFSTQDFSGTYARVDLPEFSVAQKTYRSCSLHISGKPPQTLVPVILPAKIERAFRCQGRRMTDGDLVLVDRAQEIDLIIEGGVEATVVYLTEAVHLAVLGGLHGPESAAAATAPVHVAEGPGVALLKTRLDELFRCDPASPKPGLAKAALSREIASLLATAISAASRNAPRRPSGPFQQKARYARRARDVMEAKRHEPLALAELSTEVGVSIRTLQYAFQDYFGVSPGRYHTLRRLAGARAELKRGDPAEASVTDIATHWGFFHLGRFSRTYGKYFGEPPSRTLAQREPRVFRGQRAPVARQPQPNRALTPRPSAAGLTDNARRR